MREIATFLAALVRNALTVVIGLLGLLGAATGASVVSIASELRARDFPTIVVGALSFALVVVLAASFRGWRQQARELAKAQREVDEQNVRTTGPTSVIFGGSGGAGGNATVTGDGQAFGGHGGRGGTADGPATGGEPGGPTALEALARASLGMGYQLDEFIRLSGFDPFGDELRGIGRGGDASNLDGVPGGDGDPGLILLCSPDTAQDGLNNLVAVMKPDGYTIIRRRAPDVGSASEFPLTEHFPNPYPGQPYQFTAPSDINGTCSVQVWGAGGGGGA